MSLRAELTAEVAAAFDTDLADAVTAFEGKRVVGQGPYDPVTETRPEIVETYTGRGVFSGFKQSLVDGVLVMATDEQLTALQAEVTDTPKMGDAINGMTVLNVGQDPVSATWKLHLRRI
ncbi:hypothetical protein PAEH1_01475 [Paenalcaligenes hominis]|uniref:Glutamate 5-kinase n=1 Tax=Paenalcaligenes hominis TaxID=643674 RepID=A0A1U9JXU8_9BURK|nr:hypothetical protein [Paenalcaligenes hominis]AQS50549.1 hypothetical protein PAEH1_01475 [Paenalcaligenes hominis]